VGIPACAHRSLTKPLEPSSTAAALEGPRARISPTRTHPTCPRPAGRRRRSRRIRCPSGGQIPPKRDNPWPEWARIRRDRRFRVAGSDIQLCREGLAASAQARACSRPPDPTRRSFTPPSPKSVQPCIILANEATTQKFMSEAVQNLPNLPEFSVSELSAASSARWRRISPLCGCGARFRASIRYLWPHLFRPQGRQSVLNAIIWKQGARAIALKPEMGWKWSAPDASHLSGLLALSADRGTDGAGGRGRPDGDAGGAQETPRRRRPVRCLRQEKAALPAGSDRVITSPTGAVLRDIMHRLNARFPRRVLLWPVAVQGSNAASEVAAAIAGFNALDGTTLPRPDLIIVARGGGSMEDLMRSMMSWWCARPRQPDSADLRCRHETDTP